MPTTAKLLVVGSANLDIVVPVDRHPVRGETVLGGDHVQVPGGKGANQAVAAARLGAKVGFVGRIGSDPAGDVLEASLKDVGVDITHLGRDPSAPSGIAMITVGPDGDNTIVVSPGSNALLSPEHVSAAEAFRSSADAVLLQLETPLATVQAAAIGADCIVVLDPAPAPDVELPRALLEAVDVIVPNETELATLADMPTAPVDVAELGSAARSLGVDRIVVTLGSRGAVAITSDDTVHVPAPEVVPVDTTGAGDAFRAALTIGLAEGRDLRASTEWAVRVGAAATTRRGAQPAMPTPAEVDEILGAIP